ncbi:MAG: ABC transporter ATP-binding protein [Rhodospirillales bacterium]|nr:ABC transporter ATP-binding protein [Rhodospirillales bacterium]
MARVTLADVNKIYGTGTRAVHAVQDLDLTINDGEFVALLGPSGCGKTSTLRMIVGLESVTSGRIRFDGQDVTHLEPQQRNVAMAFETYALYPNFTIEENLTFPLEVQGVPPKERRRRAHQVAEMLRITPVLKEKPPGLSGGQQQRVSLGRALIREPAVFILDEVMSHLDAHLKFQMLFDLKRLHRDLKRTMIYVTHDQVEALALADRIAVMSNAKLQQVGGRAALYNRPANAFVADFIGEPPTNFFTARPLQENGSLTMQVDNSTLRFQLSSEAQAAVNATGGERFIVGLRPQNLTLDPNRGDPNRGRLKAAIAINEYLGERSILTLESGKARFRALVPPETAAGQRDIIDLFYDPTRVMIFDAETEDLIV